MKATYLEEFTPSREQFELTLEAEWRHARFTDSPAQHWRFVPLNKDAEFFRRFPHGEPSAAPVKVAECWRESITIPEMLGAEHISVLHVRYDGKSWVYANSIFFLIRQENLPDELP